MISFMSLSEDDNLPGVMRLCEDDNLPEIMRLTLSFSLRKVG